MTELVTELAYRETMIHISPFVFSFPAGLIIVVTAFFLDTFLFCRQFYDMHTALASDGVSMCLIVLCLVRCILLYLVSFTNHCSVELPLNDETYK